MNNERHTSLLLRNRTVEIMAALQQHCKLQAAFQVIIIKLLKTSNVQVFLLMQKQKGKGGGKKKITHHYTDHQPSPKMQKHC